MTESDPAPGKPSAVPAECPQCGQVLPADAPEGACPRCLLAAVPGVETPTSDDEAATLPLTTGPGAGGAGDSDAWPDSFSGSVRPGTVIGPFRLVEKLGEGGFGVVWKAEQLQPFKRTVALKLIKPGFDSAEIVARFALERQALAVMDHPHIARVYDAGATTDGRPYFVMEWVDGRPLTRFCDGERMSIRERLELFELVCHAVQHAHQKGVIHRDLKPSNILVIKDDQGRAVPKVIDFGIAKALTDFGEENLTRSLNVIGTPVYMSPEQATGSADIDTRSDLYSLGVILYELLTGEPPLDQKALLKRALDEILRLIREEEPKKPSTRIGTFEGETQARVVAARGTAMVKLVTQLRGDLDWIVLKALSKERERRYDSAAALAGDLRRHLDRVPVEAAPPSTSYRFRKFVRRNRVQVAAGSTILVTLVLATAVSVWQAFRATEAKREATREAGKAEMARREAKAQEEVAVREAGEAEAARREAKAQQEAAVRKVREASNKAWGAARQALDDLTDAKVGFARLAEALRYEDELPPEMRDPLLPVEVAMRLLRTESGEGLPLDFELSHPHPVRFIEASDDGRRLISLDSNGTLRFWNVGAGKEGVPAVVHEGVRFAAIRPDGGRIAFNLGDGAIHVWDPEQQREVFDPLPHGGEVTCLAFSPDGKSLASGGDDGKVRLWEPLSGALLVEPMFHGSPVISCSYSDDGAYLVSVSREDVLVWGPERGLGVSEPMRQEGEIQGARLSPDGKMLVTWGRGKVWPEAILWDWTGPVRIGDPLRHEDTIRSMRFSPDGSRIVSAGAETDTRIWDTGTGKPQGAPLSHETNLAAAVFSPDGTRIVTASGDDTFGEARLWDAETRRFEIFRHEKRINSVCYTQDGSRLITAGEDGVVRIWNTKAKGSPASAGNGISDSRLLTTTSPDGRWHLTVDAAASAYRWSAPGQVVDDRFLWSEEGVRHAGYRADGRTVLVTDQNGRIVPWDPKNATPQPSLVEGAFLRAADSVDGKWIVTLDQDGGARIWDAATGKPRIDPVHHEGGATGLVLSPDGTLLATVGEDRMVRVWDARTGTAIGKGLKHDHMINSIEFHPGNSRLLTGSEDGVARIWDAASGSLLGPPLTHEGPVKKARFSPDGRFVATISLDGDSSILRLWNPEEAAPPSWTIRHPEKPILDFDFSSDGKWIVTGGEDATVRFWDASSGRTVGPFLRHEDEVLQVRFRRDGREVLSLSKAWGSGRVRSWEVALSDYLVLDDATRAILPVLIEAKGGWTADANGAIVRVSVAERLRAKREFLSRPGDDAWIRLLRRQFPY